MLLQTLGIKLMNFPQSDAYSRRFEFFNATRLPHGVACLAANITPDDVR